MTELAVVTDRMQGVDCCYCENSEPHKHTSVST